MKRSRRVVLRAIAIGGVLVATLVACQPSEVVEEPFRPTSSHADYREGLVAMEMDDTAIGSRWIEESQRALDDAFEVQIPYREIAHFDPARPEAIGFLFSALRGQQIEITLELEEGERGRMFADLFRVEEDDIEPFPQIASYSEELNRLEFQPRQDAQYILRLQPELLRGGRYSVTIASVPSIGFPVEGHGVEDIWSVFGDRRDGGSRSHEGVDIFAPRGTPVVSVVSGVARHVGRLDRGGLTVSIVDDERGLIFYYAHLDEQLVERGERVEPGDIVGTVGNTGNAVTTAPHLHFGIYEGRWRAVDPWNFLYDYDHATPVVRGDPALIGNTVRVAANAPRSGGSGAPETDLAPGDELVVLGASADRYRVRPSRGGESVYVPNSAVVAR